MKHRLSSAELAWLNRQCQSFDMSVRTGYAGYQMGGAECLAIVCDSSLLGTAVLLVTAMVNRDCDDMDWDDVIEHLHSAPSVNFDSMGLDSVAYWPDITTEELSRV